MPRVAAMTIPCSTSTAAIAKTQRLPMVCLPAQQRHAHVQSTVPYPADEAIIELDENINFALIMCLITPETRRGSLPQAPLAGPFYGASAHGAALPPLY